MGSYEIMALKRLFISAHRFMRIVVDCNEMREIEGSNAFQAKFMNICKTHIEGRSHIVG